MIDERLLAERFAAFSDLGDDSDWSDVRRRARPRRRRVLVAAVAAAVVVGVAAPAFGLHRTIVSWLETEPAPERVQLDFARLGVRAPEGMDPGIIAGSARKVMDVQLSDGVHTLMVAPTKDGGFCIQWTGLWGGCRERTAPAGPQGLSPDLNPFLLGVTWEQDQDGGARKIGGSLLAPEIERLTLTFEDGDEIEIPVTWVSEPIDAGFYLYEVPARHLRPGHRLTALVATDADGDVVARQSFRIPEPKDMERPAELPDGTEIRLPARAQPELARRLIDFRAENGKRVTLWVMPTTDGGQCFTYGRGGGCPPTDYQQTMAMAGGLSSGSNPVLFHAQVTEEVAAVELRYEDGTVERVEPVEGFVLHEVTPAHYERGYRLTLAVAVGRGGELQRHPFPTDTPGVYPCDVPIDIGLGVMACP